MSNTEFKYEDGLPDLRPGEPFFFLRAQDVLAPFAVLAYAQLLRAAAAGANTLAPKDATVEECRAHFARRDHLNAMAQNAEQRAAQMLAWQAVHHTKLPD